MNTAIYRKPCLTEAEAEVLDRRRFWWVRDHGTGKFLRFGSWVPGTQPLDISVAIGSYTIGAGEPDHYRELITVTRAGVVSDRDKQTLPCITVACEGVLAVESMVLVPGCEPFGLSPPRERQCDACRGAS